MIRKINFERKIHYQNYEFKPNYFQYNIRFHRKFQKKSFLINIVRRITESISDFEFQFAFYLEKMYLPREE